MGIAMSIIDNVISRPRGRPPKATPAGMTPVQAVFAGRLPEGLEGAFDKITAALHAFETAKNALAGIKSHEARTSAEAAARQAEVALSRAQARRDVADRIGQDDDTPSDEELERLAEARDKAAATLENFQPRVDAYGEEIERRREALYAAIEAANKTLATLGTAIEEAADQQLGIAADMAGEAYAALALRRGLTSAYNTSSFPKIRTEGRHSGKNTVEAPPSLVALYQLLEKATRRADR